MLWRRWDIVLYRLNLHVYIKFCCTVCEWDVIVMTVMCEVSMTLPTHERTMIVIPAQGMIDVRDAMTDILAEFGKEEPGECSVS